MKFKLSHNLENTELEEALEKALTGLRKKAENPEAPLPDKLSEEIRAESFRLFQKVSKNMLDEINKVIEKGE